MNTGQFIEEIRTYCVKNANESIVIKYSHYFKGGVYDGYGLSAPQIHGWVKEMLHKHNLSLPVILEASTPLLNAGKMEEISMMMLVVRGLHKQFNRQTFSQINNWYQTSINNWAHADTLAMLILPEFLKNDIVSINDFKPWLTAANKFQRRSVAVTLIKLLNERNCYDEFFTFLECLMIDKEREVHQGTGWFLREAWKRNPAETEVFLLKWKDISPRLIIQYATEKMAPEGKMRFKKVK
jgi:3-methyladenine DNA glycosylase AlkD